MFVLSIFLPLVSYLVCVFLNKLVKEEILNFVSCALMAGSTILSVVSLIFFYLDGDKSFVITNWISSGSLNIDWSLNLNLLTVTMIIMVNFVSTIIHVYSVGYMSKDPRRIIFMGYLGLFTFFMLFLVSSSNLIQLFVGWEGVGLTSYLLIGFWSHKDEANKASLKAFVANRVGDFGLLISLFTIFIVFGTININEILLLVNSHSQSYFNFFGFQVHSITLIVVTMFVGCMGKSAQFGLHIWLPDAMEGPTPVSALIHTATMVTAGVFLLILMSPLIETSKFSQDLILIIGTITCLFASCVAIFQNDIKRIIAYSTCSQLGYMFMAIGVSAYSVAYFHLLSHAFFKALLFLGAGSVIHSMSDEQDIKKMGGIYNRVPLTYTSVLIGSLALMGLPFFSGYFSKDMILEFIYLSDSDFKLFAFVIGIFGVFLTSIYSLRLLINVFHGKNCSDEKVFAHIHESPMIMVIPLIILAFFSIFFGMIFHNFFAGSSIESIWSKFMFIDSEINQSYAYDNVPKLMKKLPLMMIISSFLIVFLFYFKFPQTKQIVKEKLNFIVKFFYNKCYIDELYEIIIIRPSNYLGRGFWKSIDIDLIDNLGPNGISRLVSSFGLKVSKLQSGYLYHYVLSVVIGLTLFISIYIYIF